VPTDKRTRLVIHPFSVHLVLSSATKNKMLNTLVAIACLSVAWADEPANLVIYNAKLLGPEAIAGDTVVVTGNKISAVGFHSNLKIQKDQNTQEIDAAGNALTPGFNDSHVHFLSGSKSLGQIDLSNAERLPDVEATILDFVKSHPHLPVIQGRGWVYGSFPDGLPTKEILDRLIPDRPAILECYDGHTAWVNSKALNLAGITKTTRDPEGGIIVRDRKTGEPTGALKESAQSLVDKIIPKSSRAESLSALKVGIKAAHAFGVTSVQEAGVGAMELELFEALRADGELPLRVAFALEFKPRMNEADADKLDELRRQYSKLNIGAVKLYIDGVIEAHTAALLAPYANQKSKGLPETDQADLDRIVSMLDRRGWQLMIHAIGDGGIRMALDAIEKAGKANPLPERGRRHRLEHIESVSAEDVARFSKLGVIASMQPYHSNPNSNVFNVWAANLGPERASRAWIWKSIHDAGGQLAFGSDWPVVSIDPRLGMHSALTRQTLDGDPPEGFIPSQRLPLVKVLDAYTHSAAYAEYAEKQKGTIAVGMLADLVLWNQDLSVIPVQQVSRSEVQLTVFDGKVVYRVSQDSSN
jgi:predicted amidohydrolase YtcJ